MIALNGVIRLPDSRIMKLKDADDLGLLTWSRVENWTTPRAKKSRVAYFANWGSSKMSWEVSRQTYLKRIKKQLRL